MGDMPEMNRWQQFLLRAITPVNDIIYHFGVVLVLSVGDGRTRLWFMNYKKYLGGCDES